MRCKTMLLGGAVALALSGAATTSFAQTASPTTNQINAGQQPAQATTDQSSQSQATSTQTSTKHHARHHMHHRTHTASSQHAPSSPGEKRTTAQLNDQQLNGQAGPQSAQSMPANTNGAPQSAQPGSETNGSGFV